MRCTSITMLLAEAGLRLVQAICHYCTGPPETQCSPPH